MSEMSEKKSVKANEIVRAALKLFAQKGYALTSVEQISEKAGIGKSTIYEYYKTKEDLYVAAIMEAADEWAADMENVGRQTRDPVERLTRIAMQYTGKSSIECKAESRVFIEVLSQTFLEGGVFYSRPHLIRNVHQRIVGVVADYLLAGISRGQLKPGIARYAEKIAINFLAYLDGIHLHGLIEEGYIDIRGQVALYLDQMSQLLRLTNKKPTLSP